MSECRKEDVEWRKIINHKALKYSLAGFGTAIVAGVVIYASIPLIRELNDSFAVKEFKSIGVVATYRKHYHHFFGTMESLASADLREESLVKELAGVQKELELEKAKNSETESSEETHQIAERLKAEAGSTIARIPEGIDYEIPTHILPHQLQVLGMEYFRKHEYEKSAVIFHELTHLKEDNGFKNANIYLVSAISWYKLKHYEMASDYLKLTQKTAESGSVVLRQAILWEAVLEKARGKKGESQKALARLISLYPQSEEVAWINRTRKPAEEVKEVSHEE